MATFLDGTRHTAGRLFWLLWLAVLPAGAYGQILEIHHINVGQGTSILIRGANGTTILFDGGLPSQGRDEVVPYLESIGVMPATPLDYIIASHRDSDHYSGLREVVEEGYDALTVFDNGSTKHDSSIEAFLDTMATTTAGGVQPMPLGHVIHLGNGARATAVAVNGVVVGSGPVPGVDNENDRSIGLLVQYGGFDFLAAGDLGGGDDDNACTGRSTGQANVETPLAEAIMPGGAHPLLSAFGLEVLHANHHGSESSTNADVMNRYTPTVAAISVGGGQGSNFHHPRRDVTEGVLMAQAPCITAPAALVLQTEDGSPQGTNTSSAGFAVGDFVIATDGVRSYTITATGAVSQGANELAISGLPMTFDFDEIAADEAAPVLAGVMPQNVRATTAEIAWDTDEPATTVVRVGTAPGVYTQTVIDQRFVLDHLLTLTGLLPATTYFYQVESADVATNTTTSAEQTFTTAPTVPATVVINQLLYDAPGTDAEEEWVELFNTTNQTINLSGWRLVDNNGTGAAFTFPEGSSIAPGTFYTVANNRNVFIGRYGYQPDVHGPLPSLNNAGDALILRNREQQHVDAVAWEGGASAGTPAGWGSDTTPNAGTGVAIVRTDPRADSDRFSDWTTAPNNGNPQTQAIGPPDSAAPTISLAHSITSDSAEIVWITNEIATSAVRYGTVSGNLTDRVEDAALQTMHRVQLTGLLPATTYFFVIESTDAFGNTATSGELRFTTL